MINICFFIHNLSAPGGTERITCSLANELAASGRYKVSVLSLESFSTPFFPLYGVSVFSLGLKNADIRKMYPVALKRLRHFFRRKQIDVNIDVDVILSAISIPSAIFTKTKIISWEHYNYFVKSESLVRRYARKMAALLSSALVTLTDEDCVYYRENTKCKTDLECIYNFVEDKFKSNFPYTANRKNILCVGYFESRKGQDLLLEVWNLIPEELHSEWTLQLVGKGGMEPEIRKIVQEKKWEECLTLLPPTERVEELYEKAGIYVMCSRAEGLPMVLLEAKAEGIPIVAFDCKTGPSEIIRDGVDGYIVRNFNIKDFAYRLEKLMRDNKLRIKMSAFSKEDRRFDKNVCVKKWGKLIDKVYGIC